MSTIWVSYQEVKAAVSLEMVLRRYGVALRRVNKTYLRGKCPLPTHGPETSKESFGAHTEKNAWACQSQSCLEARGGRKGGNVLDFVALMDRCTVRDAALKLQSWFLYSGDSRSATAVTTPSETNEIVTGDTGDSEANKPLTFELKGVAASHPYLEARGITEETAVTFAVGFFPGKGLMAGRIVIPIHNANGELVAYAGRALDDNTDPRYKLPPGFNKTRELYNLHRSLACDQSRGVVIVEGFFDAMKVHQAGFPAVVALMGSSLSDTQAELIATNFRRAIIMLDGDKAGEVALPHIATRLARIIDVRIAATPGGCQPDTLSGNQLHEILDGL